MRKLTNWELDYSDYDDWGDGTVESLWSLACLLGRRLLGWGRA